MDDLITTNVAALFQDRLNYFYSDPKNFVARFSDGTQGKVYYYQSFGYAAAGIAFFLSAAGAINLGAKLIYYLEKNFWDILYTFQTKDKYIYQLDDEKKGPKFKSMMESFALESAVLTWVSMWHIFFIIGVGVASAYFILSDTYKYDDTTTIASVFKVFVMGMLVGSTNYMAAKALENNNLTIFNMVGFASKTETENSVD